ncbi:MAG: acetyl/propionyl/methylcrotonyl-CoA carboxylase subunit alpha [Proteobacteria bacterium]|nr:acetyl/propionyl/methylcrotonyl-CoA carboxylase subunit alpha [Pseudomonadota bacterium]
MFKKILIANRGEIACRIIKTARRMGIAAVAVYSDADRDALHVRLADEAVRIGAAPSVESYLAIHAIVAAARETGAEAVHPGYGFLAENAAFAGALEKKGIAFIGPGAAAIASMGDKIQSKKLAEKAGVNTIPGHGEALEDARQAVAVADRIGYPVMLKACAGGGGKGMRLARDGDEVREGFRSAVREARSSFGDDRVLMEKYIESPRHIEIQVLADGHGNVVYLGERECSIQRRYQKVIEEAPSPFIDDATRKAMGEQAVALARAVKYVSAGTVEFIVDARRHFYFLEMNTRLQVEHPVTEMVCGLDLVEWMIRIAAGEKLDFSQAEVRLDGWAIEARIYAEDPVRDFLPSVGRLVRYRPPVEDACVRVDTGVHEGDEISIHYDPLIAKLIARGDTREAAIGHMRGALDAFLVRGVPHNIAFLAAVMAHPRFAEGRLSTGFIAEEFPDGFRHADAPGGDPALFVVVGAAMHRAYEERAVTITGRPPRRKPTVAEDWVVVLKGEHHPVTVRAVDGGFDVIVEARRYQVRTAWKLGEPLFRARIDGSGLCLQVERLPVGYRLGHAGAQADVVVLHPRAAELHALMPAQKARHALEYLLSPMPGLLVSVTVEAGQAVKAGEELAVVEAMKMENVLRADRDGVVAAVHARPGDSLVVDQAILEFEKEGP